MCIYEKVGQLPARTCFPVSFFFTPIWPTRCWGRSKWRLDGNGTAAEYGLSVGVPVLHQMAPVGWGSIGKEVLAQKLRWGWVLPDAEVRSSSGGKADPQLFSVDPGLSHSLQIRSQTEADDVANDEYAPGHYCLLFSCFHSVACCFILSSIHLYFQEHSKGCESGPRLPGGGVLLQPGPGAAGLPSALHRPARHLWHPPLGRRQRAQHPAVQRATDTENPGHAEAGQGHLPVSRGPVTC